ncbi:phage tail sheath subtilisin-like domain-containing protein [Clostridioides difficile]
MNLILINKYDGEFDVDVNYTQIQLEEALKSGKFIFHKVGDEVHVLEDINTFVSHLQMIKMTIFQVIKVLEYLTKLLMILQLYLMTKYLGKVPNDKAGRITFLE